ncbi:3-oxoacyl-ACP reductase FabG [Lysinibacillus sp. NPDC059133]|uniref:3-oxoacyl-ACP reductase FabG n=1 Tax=Lysinibacillus sp. NPDC059133 TaxID=3346737 RepID=UPI0036C32CD7
MDKVVLITGGSQGIGEAIVKNFSSRGWIVYFTYNKSKVKAMKIEEENNNVYSFQADVSDYELAKNIIKTICEKHGKIDCLINNAGITKDKTISFMDQKSWNSVIETNLNGTFNYSKFALKEMCKRKSGVVINISSISGVIGIPGQTNYSASKAGIISLTRTLAKEVGAYGVRVNVISPGFINTEMTENINKEKFLPNITLGRFGETKDITGVIRFLSSDESLYITGQNLIVDGGLSI